MGVIASKHLVKRIFTRVASENEKNYLSIGGVDGAREDYGDHSSPADSV